VSNTKSEEGEEYRTKMKRRKANWKGRILRRNCPILHVIEINIVGRVKVAGRRGRRRKQLLDDLAETRDTVNCKRKH
jgi:hypothetical protein